MRVLILSWKDLKHPDAGGAERVTHELAKQLVHFGHQVTWFTAASGNSRSLETLDGVRILRYGNFWSVYFFACWHYLIYLKHEVDLVIDQIHGIPFFTPLYVRKPLLAWIYEVAGDIWDAEFSFPWSTLGKTVESFYFRLYSKTFFLTDCDATKTELLQKGVAAKNIFLLPLTVNRVNKKPLPKTGFPSLIYIGRISPVKRIQLLIYAALHLRKNFPRLSVIIAGNGKPQYVRKLKILTRKLRLTRNIKFLRRVTEAKKYELFARSWLHIHPSLKEGFGLTVLEAASAGTPTVSFDVAGLRDLIQHGKTGVIVKTETAPALSRTINNLFDLPGSLKKLSRQAHHWSKTFPLWPQQADKFEKLLTNLTNERMMKQADQSFLEYGKRK